MTTLRLDHLTAKPDRYQFRTTAFSHATVDAIVSEGIDPAKFDPIPVLKLGRDHVVGGDGHSRHEACRRLAAEDRLPASWRKQKRWTIPVRHVDADEAQRLAWTANLSRDDLSPVEEARVFQAMLDAGHDTAGVAQLAHRSANYVRKLLPLLSLATDIAERIGHTPDAAGIDKHVACVLAERFERHGIAKAAQQQLWHSTLKHADLTTTLARQVVDRLAASLAGLPPREQANLLFDMPVDAEAAVRRIADRAQHVRRATRGLAWLLQAVREGGLDVFDGVPELRDLLTSKGDAMLETIKQAGEADAAVITALALGTRPRN